MVSRGSQNPPAPHSHTESLLPADTVRGSQSLGLALFLSVLHQANNIKSHKQFMCVCVRVCMCVCLFVSQPPTNIPPTADQMLT